jgi:hypothetical protein
MGTRRFRDSYDRSDVSGCTSVVIVSWANVFRRTLSLGTEKSWEVRIGRFSIVGLRAVSASQLIGFLSMIDSLRLEDSVTTRRHSAPLGAARRGRPDEADVSMVRLDLVVDDDKAPVAVFEGRLPTKRERASIQRNGYGLNLIGVPDRHSDLAFLEDYAPFLRNLSISAMNVTDARAVVAMPQLEELSLQVSQRGPLNLSLLPNLLEFAGELRHHESVLSGQRLKRAHFQAAGKGVLSRIKAPLEVLELVDLKTTELVLDLDHPTTLKNLTITGADRVDVRRMDGLQGLEILELGECSEIVGLAHLSSLESLRVLVLENCRSLDSPESLLSLNVERIAVVDKNPFDAAFRRLTEDASADWVYFGSARRVPKGQRGRRPDAEGTIWVRGDLSHGRTTEPASGSTR